MPNDVLNRVIASPKVLDFLAPDGEVDFNNVLPPPSFEDSSTTTKLAWNVENWGTKWNAYSSERVSPTEITFDTAWEPPTPVLKELSRLFPDERIRVAFAFEARMTVWYVAEYLDGVETDFGKA